MYNISIPKNGLVLLQIPIFSNKVKTASGIEFEFDPSFDRDRHQSVMGTVMLLPDVTIINDIERVGDKQLRQVKKQVENELQVGDIVYFDRNALEVAKKWEVWGGYWEKISNSHPLQRFALIPYEFLILAIRDGKFVSINNHVICERIKVRAKEVEVNGGKVNVVDGESPIVKLASDYSNYQVAKSPFQEEYERIKGDDRIKQKDKDRLLQWLEMKYAANPELDDRASYSRQTEDLYERQLAMVKVAPANSFLKEGDIIFHEQESDLKIENSYNTTLPPFVYMKVDDVFCLVKDEQPYPIMNKVIIQLDPVETQKGSFIIPDRFQKVGGRGTIAEKGPTVDGEISVGDRVYFNILGAVILDENRYMVRDTEVICKFE